MKGGNTDDCYQNSKTKKYSIVNNWRRNQVHCTRFFDCKTYLRVALLVKNIRKVVAIMPLNKVIFKNWAFLITVFNQQKHFHPILWSQIILDVTFFEQQCYQLHRSFVLYVTHVWAPSRTKRVAVNWFYSTKDCALRIRAVSNRQCSWCAEIARYSVRLWGLLFSDAKLHQIRHIKSDLMYPIVINVLIHHPTSLVQFTNTFWTVNFMRWHAHSINFIFINIDR